MRNGTQNLVGQKRLRCNGEESQDGYTNAFCADSSGKMAENDKSHDHQHESYEAHNDAVVPNSGALKASNHFPDHQNSLNGYGPQDRVQTNHADGAKGIESA